MAIHCISFFEEDWLPRGCDRQQWKHVCQAFGNTCALYDQVNFVWDDAVHNPGGLPVYVFDEDGGQSLLLPAPFVHPVDAVYVFGVTGMDVKTVVPAESTTDVIKIDTPVAKSLWGCEAAGIAMAHRYLQSLA